MDFCFCLIATGQGLCRAMRWNVDNTNLTSCFSKWKHKGYWRLLIQWTTHNTLQGSLCRTSFYKALAFRLKPPTVLYFSLPQAKNRALLCKLCFLLHLHCSACVYCYLFVQSLMIYKTIVWENAAFWAPPIIHTTNTGYSFLIFFLKGFSCTFN